MTVDCIVIGAGIVGAAAARSLAEAGASVLLLEAFERGHDRGSSHGATRILRHGYPEADYVGLTIAAREVWRRLERSSGRRILDATGAVDHGDPAALDAIAAAMGAAGLDLDELSGAEAARRWPGLRFEERVLFSPDGGRLYAATAIDALLDAAEAAGAELRFGARVEAIGVDDDGVVVRAGGEAVRASRVVVAAGSWTPRLAGGLLQEAGRPLPRIRVTEEQPAHFPVRAGLADAAWPSFVHYPSEPDAPDVYGLLTPGEGVKVGIHGNGPEVDPDPDRRDRRIDAARLRRLQDYVERWVPGVDAARPASISCLYDNAPADDFVLDAVGPLTVATGFSGHGFKFGPVLGDLLAGLALDGTPVPERFRLAPA